MDYKEKRAQDERDEKEEQNRKKTQNSKKKKKKKEKKRIRRRQGVSDLARMPLQSDSNLYSIQYTHHATFTGLSLLSC